MKAEHALVVTNDVRTLLTQWLERLGDDYSSADVFVLRQELVDLLDAHGNSLAWLEALQRVKTEPFRARKVAPGQSR